MNHQEKEEKKRDKVYRNSIANSKEIHELKEPN